MNTAKLRSKRVILPTIAAVAVLGAGGVVWSSASGADLEGGDRERVGTAAVEAVGGGEAVDVENSDDPGEAYEVEVRQEDGTEVDVALDEDLNVVHQETDDDDADDADDVPDADDRVLDQAERTSAEQAALDAVGSGTVLDVEASDDRGEAYEVEVRDADGAEWDVTLDADFVVLDKRADG
jgi:uncharacterized membrane protein YkoI